MKWSLDVDLNIDSGREIELFELIHRSGSRIDDIKETFVGADLELIGGFFVHVNRAVDGELFNPGGQRDWSGDFGSSALGCLDDFDGGAVDGPVIKGAKANADFLIHDGKVSI